MGILVGGLRLRGAWGLRELAADFAPHPQAGDNSEDGDGELHCGIFHFGDLPGSRAVRRCLPAFTACALDLHWPDYPTNRQS